MFPSLVSTTAPPKARHSASFKPYITKNHYYDEFRPQEKEHHRSSKKVSRPNLKITINLQKNSEKSHESRMNRQSGIGEKQKRKEGSDPSLLFIRKKEWAVGEG